MMGQTHQGVDELVRRIDREWDNPANVIDSAYHEARIRISLYAPVKYAEGQQTGKVSQSWKSSTISASLSKCEQGW
jgi:hypothetical protein